MSKALVWIRKSEGAEDDIGLQIQRDELPDLARSLADEIETIDLGVHTGFSRFTADRLPLKDSFIDENTEVQDALNRIEAGEFDYLVAWDDTRIARDPFFRIVQYRCSLGECKIRYVADVPGNEMVFDIKRMVEYHVKLNEMEKSQKAKQKRQEEGLPDGRPPYGLRYNSTKTDFEPHPEEYPVALRILELKADGESQRGIARDVEPSRRTVRRVLNEYRGEIERFREAWEDRGRKEVTA